MIDWKKVNENLKCPICGAKAYIEAGTDGTEGMHIHRFPISRTLAESLSLRTMEEIVVDFDNAIKDIEKYPELVDFLIKKLEKKK